MRETRFKIGSNDLGFYVSAKDSNDEYLLTDGTIGKHIDKELTYFSSEDNAQAAINKYKMEQPMKKSDLKTGMIVEMADGAKRLVIANTLMGLKSGDGGISMQFVNDDLTLDTQLHEDIVKVYSEPQDGKDNHIGSDITWFMRDGCTNYSRCIWKRPEPVEMTLEQVCKELGKILK